MYEEITTLTAEELKEFGNPLLLECDVVDKMPLDRLSNFATMVWTLLN